jgi:hypothetical protein
MSNTDIYLATRMISIKAFICHHLHNLTRFQFEECISLTLPENKIHKGTETRNKKRHVQTDFTKKLNSISFNKLHSA